MKSESGFSFAIASQPFDFNPALVSWTYTYCTKVHKPFFGLAHIAKKKFICPELTQALSGTEGDFFRQL